MAFFLFFLPSPNVGRVMRDEWVGDEGLGFFFPDVFFPDVFSSDVFSFLSPFLEWEMEGG